MKQTAVEWLEQEFIKLEKTTGVFGVMYEIIEQAKAMEKEQCINDYKHGQNNGYMYRDGQSKIIEAEQYYNETYGKDSKPFVESFCYHKGTYTTIKDSNGNEVCGKCRLPIAKEDKQ